MLDEYRENYRSFVDSAIPNWSSIDKNTLCNLYLEHSKNKHLAEAYLAAIVCNYWGLIPKYYGISYMVASQEDVYEWMIDSIQYALKYHKWTNPKSSIYNDPNGPDKVINRCMKCRRLTHYQAVNRQKRKDSFMMMSLDEIKDNLNDCNDYFEDNSNENDVRDLSINAYIRQIYMSKNYFRAFMMDILAYHGPFTRANTTDKDNSTLNINKLIRCFLSLGSTDEYFVEFANRYNLEVDHVKKNWIKYDKSESRGILCNKIEDNLKILRHSYYFKCAK